MNLAQLNVGRLHEPLHSPRIADFVAGLEEINRLAEEAPGFVWRLVDENGANNTGLHPTGDPLEIVNLSVWQSLEALRSYVYHTAHLDYLRRRRDWFVKLRHEHMVLWWLPVGQIPTVPDALARLRWLRQHGPTAAAFTFHDPYPEPDTLAACP